MNKPTKSLSINNAIIKAQNLCARQEKCISDMVNKLYDWKLNPDDHKLVIEKLLKDNFIDEQRYAISFVKDKFIFSKWGKIKIEFTLKQKGIPVKYIQLALSEIDETNYDILLEKELIKKRKTIKETDEYLIKSKLIRFGISRGFENGKVFDMVSSIVGNEKKNKN